MSVIAAALRELIAAGLTGEDLIAAVERIEQAATPKRSKAAERTARWRASQSVTKRHGDVSPSSPPSPSSSPPTPPLITTPTTPPSLPLASLALSEQEKSSDWPPDAFDQFWRRYPHRVGKKAAAKAFAVAKRTGVPWVRMMFGLDRYIAEKPFDRAWCNPATWLNQGRWEDDPAPAATGPPARASAPSFREIAEQLRSPHEDPQPEFATAESTEFDFGGGGRLRR